MKTLTKFYACIAAAASLFAAALCAGCTPEQRYSESVGEFYSLDEAYENGWLTQGDLKNIAYYYHTRYGETEHIDQSFVPTPKTPETLSEDIQNKIKRSYLNEIIDMPNGLFDQVIIYNYFGTYHDNIVLHISDNYNAYDYVIETEHEIGGICFYEYSSAFLRVWRERITIQ